MLIVPPSHSVAEASAADQSSGPRFDRAWALALVVIVAASIGLEHLMTYLVSARTADVVSTASVIGGITVFSARRADRTWSKSLGAGALAVVISVALLAAYMR